MPVERRRPADQLLFDQGAARPSTRPQPGAQGGVGDIVYDQSRLPDQVVPKSQKVTRDLNPGKQPVPIPTDLVGKKYADAEAELAGLGLTPMRVDQESPTVPVGIVISSIRPGASRSCRARR